MVKIANPFVLAGIEQDKIHGYQKHRINSIDQLRMRC
jgi:hypothetical protein